MAIDKTIRWTVVLHVPALVKPGCTVAVKALRASDASDAAVEAIARHHALPPESITPCAVFRGAGFYSDELNGFAPVGEVRA